MKLKRLLLVGYCVLVGLVSYAQSGLIIISETGEPFKAGINSWLQTPSYSVNTYINKIDTTSIYIDVVLKNDSLPNLSKKIQLYKNETSVYIVTKTTRDTYKIRYRGNTTNNPTYKTGLSATPYSKEEKIKLPKKLIIVAQAKPDTISVAIQPTDSMVIAIKPSEVKPDTIVEVLPTDTVNIIDTMPIVKVDAGKLAEEIKAIEFEFEKLLKAKAIVESNALTTDDMVLLASQLKFDNTKLQFLKHAIEFVTDKENFTKTIELLQFETSKEELSSYIKSKTQ